MLAGVERPELDWLVEPCCADMTEVVDNKVQRECDTVITCLDLDK